MFITKLVGLGKLTSYVHKRVPTAVKVSKELRGVGQETGVGYGDVIVQEDDTDLNKYLPKSLRDSFYMPSTKSRISDVRFTVNQPVAYVFANGVTGFLDRRFCYTNDVNEALRVTPKDLDSIVNHLSSNALYAYKSELLNGFMTLPNGHRVGISGVINSKQEYKYILSLNFRIFRDVVGTASERMGQILNGNSEEGVVIKPNVDIFSGGNRNRKGVKNTLIISPPAKGKTTLLRDIGRNLSNEMYKTAIIDTRGELTAHYQGEIQVNLGPLASISVGGDKHLEIIKAVRSMSPDVIITDEIGTEQDMQALKYCLTSGVSIICTIHGNSVQDVQNRLGLDPEGIFQEIIIL
jgi:stage III sporulation protein AA